MPITVPGVNLKNLLPPPAIDPSDRPQEQMTLADMLVHKFKDFVRPVTGKVEHWLNDPVAQAEQALFVGGPMIFAGPKALTANIPKMKQAQKMVKAGKDRGQVWKDTGWFQDVDGKWKFEINDLSAKRAEGFNKLKHSRPGASRPLGDIFEHDELLNAYPDLKDIDVEKMGWSSPNAGHMSGDYSMGLHPDLMGKVNSPRNAESTILHELQHAIQGREGFAKGGNVSNLHSNLGFKHSTELDDAVADATEALMRGERYPEITRMGEKISISADEADDLIKSASNPYEQYRRLAGEAEARNVQTRMSFTPQERIDKPPWSTLDVPEDQLLVRMLQDGPAEATVWHGSPSRVPAGVAIGDELIATHNLSPEKLRHAEKMGGLPAPSIGISKTKHPLQGYGDISLIADPSLATPGRGTPVFSNDAYSAVYPTIKTKLSPIDQGKAHKYFSEPFGVENLWRVPSDKNKRAYVYGGDLMDRIYDRGFGADLANNDVVQARYLYEKGKLPKIRGDAYKWQNRVRERVRKDPKYQAWVDELPDRMGVSPEEKIFQGFTYTGKHKLAPHTLDNVVKEMKKKGKDTFNYGVGSIRAAHGKKMRSLKDLQRHRGQIVSPQEMEAVKEELNNEFFSLTDKLNRYDKHKNDNAFMHFDTVSARLEEAGKYGIDNTLKEYYPDLPEYVVDEVKGYLNKLKNAKTDYFEAKPLRAVRLNEFKGALVPKKTDKMTLDILKKQGIPIHKYKDEEGRVNLLRKFEELMFGGIPAGVIVGDEPEGDLSKMLKKKKVAK